LKQEVLPVSNVRVHTYIDKIGVELEGGWDNEPNNLKGDGSVDVPSDYSGEVVSPPLTFHKALNWTVENYPDMVNDTCGLHVHISLKNNLLYSRLTSRRFYVYFLTRMTEWGKQAGLSPSHRFWDRLEGNNTYCLKKFIPGRQISLQEKQEERYCHINYCYSLHGTIEFRLLPMFNKKETAVKAITEIVYIVKDWLSMQKREKTRQEVVTEEQLIAL
jgi:hypothetical protein